MHAVERYSIISANVGDTAKIRGSSNPAFWSHDVELLQRRAVCFGMTLHITGHGLVGRRSIRYPWTLALE